MAELDLPGCGCPGAEPIHVRAYAIHPHGMTCGGCGRRDVRVLWWVVDTHLCSRCFRVRADELDGAEL